LTVRIRFTLHVLALTIWLLLVPRTAWAAVPAKSDAHERAAARLHVRHHVRPHPAPSARRLPAGARAVRFARRLLGIPYRYGGSSPGSGFDCSGLVSFVFSHVGIRVPRTSYEQFHVGRGVARQALKPGDLVFFDGVGHVGIYVGGGRFIHAPRTGERVSIASMRSSWYRSRFVGARRVWAG
jgi:cell wall-associated NlpC family hydrolase